MKTCGKDCIPCCDFCIHAIREDGYKYNSLLTGYPIGCSKHKDKEHQEIALTLYYCDDFHCYEAEEK